MISTFIIAATSKDGFIARNADDNPFKWTSKEDKTSFINLTKDAGVVIVGSKTFDTFPRPLRDRLNIVYTRSKKYRWKSVETTAKKPSELVNDLMLRGFGGAAVIGGAEIYSMFIEAGVVDKIYLTIEPIKFGAGIPFFREDLESKFKLIHRHKLDTGTQFLTYERKL